MAVDIDEIYKRFGDATELAVGTRLAQVKSNTGTTPAIFFAKDKFPPDLNYPMVIIEVGPRQHQHSYSNYKYYDVDGNKVTQVVYDYFITFTVYSQQGGNAQQIADDLNASFERDDITQIFTSDSFGVVDNTFDITPSYFKEGEQVKEFANFLVKFTTVNKITQTEYEILSVNAGLYLRHPESSEDIVTGTIVAQQ